MPLTGSIRGQRIRRAWNPGSKLFSQKRTLQQHESVFECVCWIQSRLDSFLFLSLLVSKIGYAEQIGFHRKKMSTFSPKLSSLHDELLLYFFQGKTITITWTVKNYGMGVTAYGAWYDKVYLSRDEKRGCIRRIFKKIPLIQLLECAQQRLFEWYNEKEKIQFVIVRP